MPVSERRQQILDFIERFMEGNGYPPTIREIGRALGISSTSVVTYHLRALEKQGLIQRDPSVSRGLKLVPGAGASALQWEAMQGKRASESQVIISRQMLPSDANPTGTVHGGQILHMIDEAAGSCSTRHARRLCVTVALDSMTFHSPVRVGDLVTCKASLNWVGRTSMEVGVRVEAEDLLSGRITHTNSAYLVFVAVDESARPTPVPPLILESDEQRRRWAEAEERQQQRLTRKAREEARQGS